MFEGIEATNNLSKYRVVPVHVWRVCQKDMELTPVGSSLWIRSLPSFFVDVRFACHADSSEGVITVAELGWEVMPRPPASVSKGIATLNQVIPLREVEREVLIEPFIGEVFKVRHMPRRLLREEFYKDLALGGLNDSATDFQYLRLGRHIEGGIFGKGEGGEEQCPDVKGDYE